MFISEITLSRDMTCVTDYWFINDSQSCMRRAPAYGKQKTSNEASQFRLLISMNKKRRKELKKKNATKTNTSQIYTSMTANVIKKRRKKGKIGIKNNMTIQCPAFANNKRYDVEEK